MIPLGKRATMFVPGKLVHTSEILCQLGAGYSVWRTAAQAQELIDKKIKALQRQEDALITASLAPASAEELMVQRQTSELADMLRSIVKSTANNEHVAEVEVDGVTFSYITETEEESLSLSHDAPKAPKAPTDDGMLQRMLDKMSRLASEGAEEWDDESSMPHGNTNWQGDNKPSPAIQHADARNNSRSAPSSFSSSIRSPTSATASLGAASSSASVSSSSSSSRSSIGASSLSASAAANGGKSAKKGGVRFAEEDEVKEYAPLVRDRIPFSRPDHASGDEQPEQSPKAKPRPMATAEGAAFSGKIFERAPVAPVAQAAAPVADAAAAAAPRVSRFKQRVG